MGTHANRKDARSTGIDLTALTRLLQRDLPAAATTPLHAELLTGGRSNLTYLIRNDTNRWVLRQRPLGHALATARDSAREFHILAALAPTRVPVPEVILFHPDPEPLGSPFYLMEEIAGTVYRTRADTAELGARRAEALSFALIDTLADLHTVDVRKAGLDSVGKPLGYLERQLDRWSAQLASTHSRELPDLDRLRQRLSATLPPDHPGTIVHGDYRLDNTIIDANDRIAAVLDWELATIGHPLADLGLFAVHWADLPELPDSPLAGGVRAAAGFTPLPDLIDRYATRTGTDLTDLPWCTAFGYFKAAAILEGLHYRHLPGSAIAADTARAGEFVRPLAAQGLAELAQSGTSPGHRTR
ncbi:phosphotransferase family protein [Nocardia fluminea]|uniref:phosphotransferase family protein n=1 Tax=Nocardia fluminea TaxID=134984 RepID=UPI003434D0A9